MANNTIVLSANYNYINQVTATIKSILYHNRNINFYLLNDDIPKDWFINLNHRIAALGSVIYDRKINTFTYGRLLISRLIPADRVLYLDSDVIVQDDLTNLFNLDLKNHPIAAANDIAGSFFNAGVMLIDNRMLRRKPSLIQEFLNYGQNNALQDTNQAILNHFFMNDRVNLPLKYNFPIGYDSIAFYNSQIAPGFQEKLSEVNHPIILHYSSKDKPWKMTSGGQMRNTWWQYANMNWYDLIMRKPLVSKDYNHKGHLFTFTASDQLVHIEELAQALPQFDFDIAAWTKMSPTLLKLIHFPNVHLYPRIAGPLIDELIQHACAYLDINHEGKEEQFMDRFIQENKPILAFRSVADRHYYGEALQQTFDDNEVQSMVTAIHNLSK